MRQVKVAIIGHGHLGKWHTQKAQALETCELIAIVEPFNQEQIKEMYPSVNVVSKIDEVMDEIEAVVIVTPTSTHFELVQQCLKAGKHVFCEKPLCSTYEQAQSLEPLIKKSKLQVGHSERCHQAWDEVAPKIKEIKGPRTFKINRFAPFKGRATDVDVVQDLMIHDIDLMLFLLGAQPQAVRSIGHKIRTDKWDHVTSHFFFENGDQAIITSGRNHTKEVRELEVMSADGCIHVDLFANKISFGTSTQFDDESFVKTHDYEKRDHLFIEQEQFYHSILNDVPEMVTYDDGKKAVYFVSKVLESLESGSELNV